MTCLRTQEWAADGVGHAPEDTALDLAREDDGWQHAPACPEHRVSPSADNVRAWCGLRLLAVVEH